MTVFVPVFEAAQDVAYALFGQDYINALFNQDERWSLSDEGAVRAALFGAIYDNPHDPIAVKAAKTRQREANRMHWIACDRLCEGFRRRNLKLLAVSPDEKLVRQVDDLMLQNDDPRKLVDAGFINDEEYQNSNREVISRIFCLFVLRNELDNFLLTIRSTTANPLGSAVGEPADSGDCAADGGSSAPSGEGEKPTMTKSLIRTTTDQQNEEACGSWIKKLAGDGVRKTMTKGEVFEMARAKDRWPKLSRGAFERAWAANAPAEWRSPGRRRKPQTPKSNPVAIS